MQFQLNHLVRATLHRMPKLLQVKLELYKYLKLPCHGEYVAPWFVMPIEKLDYHEYQLTDQLIDQAMISLDRS